MRRSRCGFRKFVGAQGNSISTSGCRDIFVQLFGEGGEEVIFRDRGYGSSSVKQPLLSYGRLPRQGWSIVMRPDGPKLEHVEAEVRIPIEFCQDSLSVRGSIRRVMWCVIFQRRCPLHGLRLGRPKVLVLGEQLPRAILSCSAKPSDLSTLPRSMVWVSGLIARLWLLMEVSGT